MLFLSNIYPRKRVYIEKDKKSNEEIIKPLVNFLKKILEETVKKLD